QNFVAKYFSVGEAQNAVNPDGFTSILTKPQRKILAPKSGSSLTALAKLPSGRNIPLNHIFGGNNV
ncbi:MAG: hypothetical protein IJC55_03810, partial [Clostridia bacterium]|nr:hypothetical protein [Clostridia bacterium]